MKRRYGLLTALLLLSIGGFFAFHKYNVKAESNVTVQIESYFDEFNTISTELTNQKIGSKVSFQSSISSLEGYTFAYWIYNGVVQEGLFVETPFTVTSNAHIIAVFRPNNQYACLFMDANGHLIDIQYVSSGGNATDIPLESLPSKPGYVVASAKWDKSLTNVTSNMIYMLQYELSSSASYTVSVLNGSGDGTYGYDSVITVSADTAPVGQNFQYWVMGDKIVSRQSNYAFTVVSDVSIEAIFSDESVIEFPMVTLSDDLIARSGYQTYLGQFHIPTGFEYVEHGLIVSSEVGVIDLNSTSITRYQGSKYNPLTNEFVMSVPTTVTNWLSHRGYLIIRNSDGDLMTVYNELVTSSSVAPSDLFFSYYIEGSSNNKAIAIYNGTGSTVDLSLYKVKVYANGASTATNTISLVGTLATNDVYVIANTSANSTILGMANLTTGSLQHNGDDAIQLLHNSTVIDIIGQVGVDPGTEWGSGLTSTADNSLSRKSDIYTGRTDTGAFDPSIEWNGFAVDTTTGLDSHTYSGTSAKTISTIEAHLPNRTYQINDSINLTNGYLRVFYSDGSATILTLTSEMITDFSSNTSGLKTLTITYQGKTDTLTYLVEAYETSTDLLIHYIDIGATGGGPGEAMLIQYNGIDILIDSGENASAATNALLAFLSSTITDGTIEYIIATHQDADHIGGFTEVIDAYNVTNAILYSTPASIATVLRNTFEAAVTAEGSTVYYAYDLATSMDPSITITEGVNLEFINTNYLQTANANYSSIVFVLDAFGTRVLFNGDAEQNQEAVYGPLVGDVDIFKLGHHGTVNATTSTLLNNITPEVAIVTNGDFLGNEYNHPTYDALARIYSYSNLVPIYAVTGGNWSSETLMNQRNGTITVSVNGTGYAIVSDYYESNPMEISNTDYWHNALNTTGSSGYYYASSTGIITASAFKDALSLVIDGHTSYSYTAITDILKVVDADPAISGNVLLFYTNRSQSAETFVGSTGNQDYWNREHIWAQSHGIDEALPAYSDLHHIRATDVSVNAERGDLDFGIVSTHDGSTLVSDTYGAVSSYNYIGNSYFEPRDDIKGDVARMLFYMAVRYEGNNGEIDLELLNGLTSSVSNNIGDLTTLLLWNELDPVSEAEVLRNNLVYSYQGNRNPFIDHPEWVELIFGSGV
ncbi:MAG: hypothetical protein CVV56_05035 [Tenericutes bacterium HGW-Tenericutes-1]|jgi:endonuclease I/beta-lactamase superfamily II metal-dependent hydrolase|nr:MAG: hypothetical protein CVV56_05035 [Tenericutes bacterium HGW-Tenericutes-1]